MKCQRCGADSDVKDTRDYLGVFLRRRRECYNGHKFVTFEVFAGNLDRRKLAVTVKGIADRRVQADRRKRVRSASELSSTQLATELGITEARVRQIRGEAKAPPKPVPLPSPVRPAAPVVNKRARAPEPSAAETVSKALDHLATDPLERWMRG